MQSFLKAPNISQIRFAMFYETWNLGFDAGRESTPVTFQMELHFDAERLRSQRATSTTSPICVSTAARWSSCT